MRYVLLSAVLLVAAACGGSDDGGGGSGPVFNSGFTKTWNGTASVTIGAGSPFSYSAYMVLAVAGNQMTVGAFCPDGSGSVSVTGSGDTATWTGSYACPPVSMTGCGAVTFTFTAAMVTLNSGPSLTSQGSGTGNGCSVTNPFTMSFTGY